MTLQRAGQHASDRGGKRQAFRAWRRSRPFWGGLLLMLAGCEMLAIPLSGVLINGQVKFVIYVGIGGVFGAGIGALLVTAGIVVFFNPANRVFYGVAGIVLGILSFPASNLGGLFLGMLLAIIGGALAFAWVPGEPAPLTSDITCAEQPGLDGNGPEGRLRPESRLRPASSGSRTFAAAALPAVLVAGLAGSGGAISSGDPSQGSGSCLLGIVCSPASPSPGTGSSGSGTPSPSDTGSPGPRPRSPRPAGRRADPAKSARAKRAKPSGVGAPSAATVLTARSATMKHFNFVGVATVPAAGRNEQALEFTASTATMYGVRISAAQDGTTIESGSPSLRFGGGMTLYATRLCGRVYGVAPELCFTPSRAGEVTLKLASVLGTSAPITMTSITIDQFTAFAATLGCGTLNMRA